MNPLQRPERAKRFVGALTIGLALWLAFIVRMTNNVGPSSAVASGVEVSPTGESSALPADATTGAVRAWRAVGHVANYEGFSTSESAVTLTFEARATGEPFEIVVARAGQSSEVLDVRGPLPRGAKSFEAAELEALNEQATNEVENVHLVPREDDEPGIAVEWTNFYKAPVPGLGGDVCTVRLLGVTGEVVVERQVAVDAPLNEAARDAISFLELPPPQGVIHPEPSVRCEEWRGGYRPVGASRFSSDPPGESAQGRRPDRGWVVQKLEWSGPEFGSVWECEGRARDASGDVVASGTARVYRNPADTPDRDVNAAIQVEVRGDADDIATTRAACRLINSELEP